MGKSKSDDVAIGKFDILATYAYAKALRGGMSEPEAKERGIVAAILGAKSRLGHSGDQRPRRRLPSRRKRR